MSKAGKKKGRTRRKKDSEYDAIVDRTAWHPYQRACGYESQHRVETIEAAFRNNLDGALTFHVKAAADQVDVYRELHAYTRKVRAALAPAR